jgi:hypothetical protein
VATSLGVRSVSLSVLLTLLAQAVLAETPAAVPEKLVVGDAYKVTWHDTLAPEEGILVQQTDKWLVLGYVIGGCCAESKLPRFVESAFEIWSDWNPFGHILETEDIPLIGHKLVKRTPFYNKAYIWLPRNQIKAVEHIAEAHPLVKAQFKNDTPPLKSFGTVTTGDGKTTTATSSPHLTVAENEVSSSDNGQEKKFSLADIQCIRQQVPFDHLKFKAEYDGKQAAN